MNSIKRKKKLILTVGIIGLVSQVPTAHALESKAKAPAATYVLDDGIMILDGNAAAKYLEKNRDHKAQITPKKQATKASPNYASKGSVNEQLVRFCRSQLGRKVGNGQCSELAVLGLPAVGAVLDFNNLWGNFVCQYDAVNGRPILRLGPAGVNPRNRRKADVRPGDIIQYENVRFMKKWDNGYSEKTFPHHTSVISQVSKDGQTIKVYEQNVNGTQYVLETALYMPEMTTGTMRISRPIPR